ncbi:hypothetical protein P7K49_031231 [Saguinus oedipus]|uniref:Ig-like domain-containing protein n=1 Tax=Saguinus oedipus TaxID=9490 RepID=A0ABQ9U4G0_SAGOE|nr:hypothetical protein P7K49_031231 [Saguinus oedipus]
MMFIERWLGWALVHLQDFKLDVQHVIEVDEGNTAVIACHLPESHPKAQVRYSVKQEWLEASRGNYLIMPSGNLQIVNASQEDEGMYKCAAYNPVTQEVKTSGSSDRLRVRRKARAHLLGDGASLMGSQRWEGRSVPGGAASQLQFSVHWLLPGGTPGTQRGILSPVAGFGASLSQHTAPGLALASSTAEAARIIYPPEAQTIIVTKGQSLILECVASGIPPPRVTWAKDGSSVTGYNKTRFLLSNLLIDTTSEEDSGTYRCMADNGVGQPGAAVTLYHVQVFEPPEVTMELSQLVIPWGQSAKLTCEVRGNPPPSVLWLRNAVPLVSSQRLRLSRRALRVLRMEPEDEGVYQCMAENEVGSAHAVVRLRTSRPIGKGPHGAAVLTSRHEGTAPSPAEAKKEGAGFPPREQIDLVHWRRTAHGLRRTAGHRDDRDTRAVFHRARLGGTEQVVAGLMPGPPGLSDFCFLPRNDSPAGTTPGLWQDYEPATGTPPAPPSSPGSPEQMLRGRPALPRPSTSVQPASPQCPGEKGQGAPAEAPIILSSPRTSKTDSYELVWRPRHEGSGRAPILYYVVKHRKPSPVWPSPVWRRCPPQSPPRCGAAAHLRALPGVALPGVAPLPPLRALPGVALPGVAPLPPSDPSPVWPSPVWRRCPPSEPSPVWRRCPPQTPPRCGPPRCGAAAPPQSPPRCGAAAHLRALPGVAPLPPLRALPGVAPLPPSALPGVAPLPPSEPSPVWRRCPPQSPPRCGAAAPLRALPGVAPLPPSALPGVAPLPPSEPSPVWLRCPPQTPPRCGSAAPLRALPGVAPLPPLRPLPARLSRVTAPQPSPLELLKPEPVIPTSNQALLSPPVSPVQLPGGWL